MYLQKSFKKKLILFFVIFIITLIGLSFLLKIKSVKEFVKIEDKKLIYITGNFKSTLENELRTKKIYDDDIKKIISSYSKVGLDFKKLRENDDYIITLSSTSKFLSMLIDKGDFSYSVEKSTSGIFLYQKNENLINYSTSSVDGEISDNLWSSMAAKNVPADIILGFTDIFAWEVDFLTEVRNGDSFKVVYYTRKNQKGKVIDRKILAAMYNGEETGKNIMVYFNGNYYNENGEGARSMFLKAPLQYRRISSYFTYKRFHPVLRYVRPHLGIDYAAQTGTPVSSVADGVITYKGKKGGYGNFIEIKHPLGYYTTYGHLSKYAKNIYVGKKVKQGDLIGYVGATGIATGPHLDFRIRQGNQFINYLKMKRTSNIRLDKKYIPDLKKKIEEFF